MASVGQVVGTSVSYRRRVLLWVALVAVIVAVLSFQAALPEYNILPTLPGNLAATTVLAVFMAALFCEYIDSSLGMGYGTTLTPILLLAGFEPLSIVPCVLVSELCTGLSATIMHQRDGNVDFFRDSHARNTAILLTVLSVVGTVAAVSLALSVSKFWLTAIIAVIILTVGVATLATVHRQLRYRRSHIVALGAVAAFNKGLSGGGYGPLVTAGQVVSGMNAKHAVAITSLAESFTCLVGLLAYFFMTSAGTIDWNLAAPLTVGAMLSVPMATLTVKRLSEPLMRASVGVLTCILGLVMIYTKLM